MAEASDPYRVLGVDKTASADDIRRAYRQLARQYHPDVKPNDAAALERFKAITAAYEVLSDAKKRALFDEFGDVGLREGFNAEQARAWAQQSRASGGAGSDPFAGLGDVFGDLFGGGMGRGARREAPLRATVRIRFAEALQGCERTLQIPRVDLCPACHGAPQRREHCRRCFGDGTAQVVSPLTVRIPPGTRPQSVLRVADKHGATQGREVQLTIDIEPHPYFRFEGEDLLLRLPLSLSEALLGGKISVPTPCGTVQLNVPPGTQPGTRLRLRGRGGKRRGRDADLFAEVSLVLPPRIGEAQHEALRALEQTYPGPVRGRDWQL